MKCQFVVGQKVVCVAGGPWKLGAGNGHDNAHPETSKIYEIIGLFISGNEVYIRLVGFYDGYHHASFRPLQERKTDISVFEKILRNATNKELV